LGGENMIAIHPADRPRPRLVVEVLYRLIEQDGIPPLGPVWLTEQEIGGPGRCLRRAWNARSGAPETRAAPDPVTRPGEE